MNNSDMIKELEKYIKDKENTLYREDSLKLQCADSLKTALEEKNSNPECPSKHNRSVVLITRARNDAKYNYVYDGRLQQYLERVSQKVMKPEEYIDYKIDGYVIDKKLAGDGVESSRKHSIDLFLSPDKHCKMSIHKLQLQAAFLTKKSKCINNLKKITEGLQSYDMSSKGFSRAYSQNLKGLIRDKCKLLAYDEIKEAKSGQLANIEASLKTIFSSNWFGGIPSGIKDAIALKRAEIQAMPATSSSSVFSSAGDTPLDIKAHIKSKKQQIESTEQPIESTLFSVGKQKNGPEKPLSLAALEPVSAVGCGDVEMCVTSIRRDMLPS